MQSHTSARMLYRLLIISLVVFAASCQSVGEQVRPLCTATNKFKKLKIQTHADHSPDKVKDHNGNAADKVHTCPGDAVRWELRDYKFVITFKHDSPFTWTTQEAIDIGKGRWGVVGIVTNASPKEVDHEYSVDVVGHPPILDPIIIVDK